MTADERILAIRERLAEAKNMMGVQPLVMGLDRADLAFLLDRVEKLEAVRKAARKALAHSHGGHGWNVALRAALDAAKDWAPREGT